TGPAAIICRLISSIASRNSGVSTGVKLQNKAANKVPVRFAASTIDHIRNSPRRLAQVNSAATGNTTVVFSVNNCWRASTTIARRLVAAYALAIVRHPTCPRDDLVWRETAANREPPVPEAARNHTFRAAVPKNAPSKSEAQMRDPSDTPKPGSKSETASAIRD